MPVILQLMGMRIHHVSVFCVVLMSDKQEVIVKSGTKLKDKVDVAAPDLEGQCAYE
jgi:hypothetical protein